MWHQIVFLETVYSHWPEIDVHSSGQRQGSNICKKKSLEMPNFGDDWMLPPSPTQHSSFGARAPLRAEIGRDCRQVPGRRRIHWISLQTPKINNYTWNWVCLEVGSTNFHGKAVPYQNCHKIRKPTILTIYDTRRKIGPTLDLHHFQRAKSGTPNLTTR